MFWLRVGDSSSGCHISFEVFTFADRFAVWDFWIIISFCLLMQNDWRLSHVNVTVSSSFTSTQKVLEKECWQPFCLICFNRCLIRSRLSVSWILGFVIRRWRSLSNTRANGGQMIIAAIRGHRDHWSVRKNRPLQQLLLEDFQKRSCGNMSQVTSLSLLCSLTFGFVQSWQIYLLHMKSLKHVAFKDVLHYATLYLLKCFFGVTVAQDQKHTAATKFLKIKQSSQTHKSLCKNSNG